MNTNDYLEQGFVMVRSDTDPLPPETEAVIDLGPFTIGRIHVLGDSVVIHAADSDDDETRILIIQSDPCGQPRLYATPDLFVEMDAFDLPS